MSAPERIRAMLDAKTREVKTWSTCSEKIFREVLYEEPRVYG